MSIFWSNILINARKHLEVATIKSWLLEVTTSCGHDFTKFCCVTYLPVWYLRSFDLEITDNRNINYSELRRVKTIWHIKKWTNKKKRNFANWVSSSPESTWKFSLTLSCDWFWKVTIPFRQIRYKTYKTQPLLGNSRFLLLQVVHIS